MHTIFVLFNAASATAVDWALIAGNVLALITLPSILLRRRGRPIAALSWICGVFAFPVFGVLAWWLIGRSHLQRYRRRRSISAQRLSALRVLPVADESRTQFEHIVPRTARGVAAFCSLSNNLRLLTEGAAKRSMLEAIHAAQHTVHALFYIWEDDATGDAFRQLLIRKAKEGVVIRVLVDAIGSPAFRSSFARPLREAGVEVALFLPPKLLLRPTINFRNHRKILIVDDELAFTGGVNIGDPYMRDWDDLQLRVQGPAVTGLVEVFVDDWFFATGCEIHGSIEQRPQAESGGDECAVLATGPADPQPWLHDSFFAACVSASSRIWIATPYFIPSTSVVSALRAASFRGVDVRILVPERPDVRVIRWASRSYYPPLLEAGVRIFEARGRMMHAKALLVDEALASVGSANIDARSFRLNFEVGCFFSAKHASEDLAEWFQERERAARVVQLAEVRQEPLHVALRGAVAHLLSPLL